MRRIFITGGSSGIALLLPLTKIVTMPPDKRGGIALEETGNAAPVMAL
jgi:hypothetical protein